MVNKNLKIQWLTKSSSMKQYVDGDQSTPLSGGRLYEIQAIDVLKDTYDVGINPNYIKKENALNYLIKNHTNTIDADICILDPYILAYGKFDVSKKNIAIIHHIDEDLGKNSLLGQLFLKRMISNLKQVELVVVVSEFWKDYLTNKGIKNIEIIYNSYDLEKFKFSEGQFNAFKSKLGFDELKPIIYLGKMGSGKGVDEALKYIDTTKYNLVVTGKKDHKSNLISTRFFSESEFPIFLSLCDVVLAMSTMQEGWNRIAHESLLVKTPVIGTGSGGMGELLLKSGQVIIKDLNVLNQKIDYCIENSNRLSEAGYKYTSNFDLNYFKSRWINLIENLAC